MPSAFRHFYEFGQFRLDGDKHRLMRDGQLVPLSPKAVDALLVLVQNPGKPLEREELMKAVWADAFVEDANLTVAISNLRKALGENGDTPQYIETVPRVGYRFVAAVREVREEPASLVVEKHTLSRTVIEEELIHDEPRAVAKTEAIAVQPALAGRLPVFVRRPLTALLLAAIVLCALTMGAIFYFKGERTSIPPDRAAIMTIKSIAVLPPKALGGEAENTSLSLGLADALITRLGGLRKIVVRPTTAMIRFGSNQDAVGAGRALGVDAVLDGTVQRDRGRVRVTIRLVNVANEMQLWTANFDGTDADIFKLQDSVSQQVAEALFTNLSQDEKALLTKQQTTNTEAYALYLKGNHFWNKRGVEAAKSFEYFRKAIELDPNFARAYVGLANVNAVSSNPSPEAEALIDKALQLDNSLAEAHATYGFISMFHHWDWATSERELDRAIELNPYSSTAHHWKGVYLSLRGRLDEAKIEMLRALDLDPLSLIIMADIGQLHYFAHEYDQAIDYCNRALALDGEFYVAHEYLIDIYRMNGLEQEALNEMMKVHSWYITPEAKQRLREVFARGGMRAVLAQQHDNYLKGNSNEPGVPIGRARSYCRVGDNEHALYWLDRAVNGPKNFWLPYINVDPLYDPLRTDPRFQDLLHKMGV